MSYEACLAAVREAAPNLTEPEFKEIAEELDKLRNEKLASNEATTLVEATEMAAAEVADNIRRGAVSKAKDILVNEARAGGLRSYALDQFYSEAHKGLLAKSVGIQSDKIGTRDSVDALQHAKHEQYLGGMLGEMQEQGVYDLFASNAMEAEVARTLRAMREGKDIMVPEEARTIAKLIAKYQDLSSADLISVGVPLKLRHDYITAQSHDYQRVRRAAGTFVKADSPEHYKAWSDFIRPLLDPTKTNLSDEFLRAVYSDIVSGKHHMPDINDQPSGYVGPANLAKRITAARVLHFKDADAWMTYNDKFGHGNLYSSVIRSLELKSHQYALIHHFGTNPKYTLNRAAQMIETQLKLDGKDELAREFTKNMEAVKRQFSYIDGTTRIAENEVMAEWGTGIRIVESMMKLPFMLLSQFGDLATFAGEIRSVLGKNYLSGLKDAVVGLGVNLPPAEKARFYSMIGVHADGAIADLAAKFGSLDNPVGKMASYQQTFFKLVGAQFWNEKMSRRAAEVISHAVALEKSTPFEQLPQRLQQAFGWYNINRYDWDAIRGNVQTFDNRDFVIAEGLKGEVGNKWRTFLADRVDYAVLQPDARANYYMMWGTDIKRGTAAGEALRFIMQFKGYPVAFTQRVLGRELRSYGEGKVGESVKGIAQLMLFATSLGYLSLTAKELAKGREPRDVENPEIFWKTLLSSAMQGGGLGIYGDFLFGEANRGGLSTAATVVGPFFGDVGAVMDMWKRVIRGEDVSMDALKMGMKTAAALHPVSSVIVNGYPRIALDYLFLYEMMEEVQPGYLRKMERRMERENAQEFMFPPSQYAR